MGRDLIPKRSFFKVMLSQRFQPLPLLLGLKFLPGVVESLTLVSLALEYPWRLSTQRYLNSSLFSWMIWDWQAAFPRSFLSSQYSDM